MSPLWGEGQVSVLDHTNHKREGKGILGGVSILTISALLVKVIGLLYRIPMLNLLGTEGMGYFNTAYELYALFCVIATSGLPVAMSVLISSSAEHLDGKQTAGRIFRVSLFSFLIIGSAGSLLLYGFSDGLAHLLKNSGAAAGMRMISPTVLLICLSSAFRGYFQGKHAMTPTAVSQVIEALGKLILGLLFAGWAKGRGCDLPVIAAYAVLGLTIGTGISVVYLWIHKTVSDRLTRTPMGLIKDRHADLEILRRLLMTAVPVTFGAAILSITKVVDLVLILRRIQGEGTAAGTANMLYGCYSTLVLPLFHILPTLTTSVSLPTIPALSSALGKTSSEGYSRAREIVLSALRMTLVIAIPAAIGLSVFSKDVLMLLFGAQPQAVDLAAPWLSCVALSVPMSCLITVSSGLLQAAGHAAKPVLSLILGTLVKVISAYILLGLPEIGMMGAPISTLACDSVIALLNFIFIARLVPEILPSAKDFLVIFVFPTMAGGGSVAFIWWLRQRLGWDNITSVHTLGAIAAVMCVYGAICLLFLWYAKRDSKIENKDKI